MSDTPIFTQLLIEYQRAGRRLPWQYSVKPTDSIRTLEATSPGVIPTFNIRIDPEKTQNSIENQIRLAKILNERIKRGFW